MSIRDLSHNLIPLDKMINKTCSQISLKETICLIFHAIDIASTTDTDWDLLYEQFKTDLEQQRFNNWPQLEITLNNYAKRIDILTISKPFDASNNIFMLLFRLLYIESYKRPYILKSYGYHRILSYKLKHRAGNRHSISVADLSITDLFRLLEIFLSYYSQIYSDTGSIEHQLVKVILTKLSN